MSEYTIKARKFLRETKTKSKVKYFSYGTYFPEDKQEREIYKVTLKTLKGSYSFTFGQSIVDCGREPTAYDILSCLTKYEPGTFENFCNEFGYDTDLRVTEKVYKAVCKEYKSLCRLYTQEELIKLQEIQ